MCRRPFLATLSVACSLLVAGSCWAATVEPGQGNLYINHGQGYLPVTGPVEGNVGDSIMVSPGGSGVLVYADGCRVNVLPGGVTTITPSSPCVNPYGQNQPPPPDTGLSPSMIAGGAAILAITGVIIYEATKSVSP